MIFDISPGNALVCSVNGHRSGWNGHVCADAATWNCGAKQKFRDDYCERGDNRCFHTFLFAPHAPRVTIDDKGAGWILEVDPTALNDQILLFSNRPFAEPNGLRETVGKQEIVYGAYRIRSVEKRDAAYGWTVWDLFPYPDGWVRMEHLHIDLPFFRRLEGPYVREIERAVVEKLFRRAYEKSVEPGRTWPNPELAPRLKGFAENISAWLDIAARRLPPPPATTRRIATPVAAPNAVRSGGSFATLGDVLPKRMPLLPQGADRREAPAQAAAAASATSETRAIAVGDLIDEPRFDAITKLYGGRTLQSLRIAGLTKTIIILTGAPGSGKSHLAANLLAEPDSGRTCIIAVSTTWRGKEDLLGYVNPISNEFEPTPFTRFLLEAEKAWNGGDRRTRIVVFEEFNLSPPEHWFSEILVRSQYAHDDVANRTIELGGKGVRGFPNDQKPRVVLAPSVRFVATINRDATARPLSARVLDRSALVEIGIPPRAALAEAGLVLEPERVQAIEELDFCVQALGSGFSLRTALSLRACLDRKSDLGMDDWDILDQVLLMEVLSKVRLLAADQTSESTMERLTAWADEYGKQLGRCAQCVGEWSERLENGQDVIQA